MKLRRMIGQEETEPKVAQESCPRSGSLAQEDQRRQAGCFFEEREVILTNFSSSLSIIAQGSLPCPLSSQNRNNFLYSITNNKEKLVP